MIKYICGIFMSLVSLVSHADTTILIGFPPGGGQHLIGLIVEEGLRELGYNPILISKPGAGGVIAMNECANNPNEKTLCLATQSQLVHSSILSPDAVKYDPTQLTYIKLIGESPMVLLSNISNTKSLNDVLLDIRDNKVTFASGALGNTFVAESLMKHVKSKQGIVVSYKGVGPAIVDLMGGHVSYSVAPYTAVKSQVDKGLVRIVASLDENSHLPGAPKILNFSVPPTRFGFVASPNLSLRAKELQTQILVDVMKNKTVQNKLKEQGIYVANINLSGDEYKRMIIHERQMMIK